MGLRDRAVVLHFQAVALLREARQQQAVDVHVGHLAQHRHAALCGQVQEVGVDVHRPVVETHVDDDRAVGQVELRPRGIAVFCAELRVEVVEQRVERLDVLPFAVQVDAFVVQVALHGTLRGVHDRRNKGKCPFHGSLSGLTVILLRA